MLLSRLGLSLVIGTAVFHTAALADHPTVAFSGEGVGAINTISSAPQIPGAWGFGLRTEIINNDEFSNADLETFAARGQEGVHSIDRITSTSISLTYGMTEQLGVSIRLPYIKRENIREGEIEGGLPEAHLHGDSSGYGDLLVFGQYSLPRTRGVEMSLLFGVKAPVGETNEKDIAGERFETEFQPGTGSWDYLLGGAISKTQGNFAYHANLLINKTTTGSQATEIGDSVSYNAALTYNLSASHDGYNHNQNQNQNHDHDHDRRLARMGLQWEFSIELNGQTRRKNVVSGTSDDHSGGTTVLISPGIRVSSGRFSGFISYGRPVIENQNGMQTDMDDRVVAGVSMAL